MMVPLIARTSAMPATTAILVPTRRTRKVLNAPPASTVLKAQNCQLLALTASTLSEAPRVKTTVLIVLKDSTV